MSKKKKEWRAEKECLLSLGLEERRKQYGDNYLALDKIPTWRDPLNSPAPAGEKEQPVSLCDKVSLHKGDITILEVDAIVNAANSSLLGGGGVDGCIHRAAGHFLYDECHSLNGCETGKAKITCGYDLPAKYVIHTVGPIARGNVGNSQKEALKSCYKHSLKLMKDYNLRSVAFPCISTGIYGFPNEPAAEIAMRTVRDWLKENKDKVDRIIFCVFLDTDYVIYKRKMSDYFFPDKGEHEEGNAAQTNDGAEKKDPEDIAMLSQDPMKNDDTQDVEMMSQSQEDADVEMTNADTESQGPETPTEENPAKEINTESQEPGSETENVTEEKTPADIKPEPQKDQENSMGSSKQESKGLMESAETNDDPKHLDGSPEEPEQVNQTDSSQSKDDPDDKSEPIKK